MGGDPRGGDSDPRSVLTEAGPRVVGERGAPFSNPSIGRRTGYTVTNDRTGKVSYRTPVFDEKGQQRGYTSDPQFPSLAVALADLLGGKERLQTYTGPGRYNPFNKNNTYDRETGIVTPGPPIFDDNDEQYDRGSVDPFAAQRAELAAARANRANALANKQSQLAAAFGAFDDDFYTDLGTSFTDYQNPLLTQGYDDSLRGIYEGFKAKGLLSQAEVDSAISGLDAARDRERNRIAQGASAYSEARRNEVAAKQKKLGDQLAGLVGGATTAADVNAQTEAINAFDFSDEVDKLKTPAAKGDLNFFEGFDKVTAKSRPITNVAAVSATGAPQNAERIAAGRSNTGINSPYQGGSLKVVS